MKRLEQTFRILFMGFMLCVAGCGGDKDSPTAPSEEIPKGPQGQKLEVWTENWDNGQIKLEYQYFREEQSNQPIQHGYYKSYYEDGTYKQRGQFREGSKEGTFVSFDAEGTIIDEDIYARGVCVASCEWTRTLVEVTLITVILFNRPPTAALSSRGTPGLMGTAPLTSG